MLTGQFGILGKVSYDWKCLGVLRHISNAWLMAITALGLGVYTWFMACALVRLFRGRNEFGFGCRDTQLTTDEGYELVLTACCLRITTRHDLARAWDDRSAEDSLRAHSNSLLRESARVWAADTREPRSLVMITMWPPFGPHTELVPDGTLSALNTRFSIKYTHTHTQLSYTIFIYLHYQH